MVLQISLCYLSGCACYAKNQILLHTFHVDKGNFSFNKYWPNEEIFMPLNFLRSKENKWQWIEPEPLTLNMLVESAKAGYWLYD